MHLRILNSLSEIAAADWNRLTDGTNPFVRHEFLYTLERAGCIGTGTGWTPQHLLVTDRPGGNALGAVPLYLKDHSYGEYVFDWAWANAYARAGLEYYPKLVAAVPFTPATGSRLLTAPQADRAAVANTLIEAASAHAQQLRVSSLHWLFTTESEIQLLKCHGLLHRSGFQFHWSNPGYRDFEDFLASFTADKRKKIRRERRAVREAGVTVEMRDGLALDASDWNRFHEFYHATVRAHGAIPYLTPAFFRMVGETMPQSTLLALARRGSTTIGGALFFRGRDTLYGRYWGGTEHVPGLHFETCYYVAIEYCIAHRLRRFEAGAQGEHKLARGFVPTPTYSAHWLAHPQFARAVADFLAREHGSLEYAMHELNEHAPFKQRNGANSLRAEL
ncbi:MAG: N-acetyltransferase [Gammaproteobacteria bacterium]|nr:N-acetyltransferase [Gammaproteobacteria bacterium]